jgi:hypothetical protein
VADDQLERQPPQSIRIGRQRLRLFRSQAQPVHAGVDVERGDRGLAARRVPGEALDLLQAVQDRHELGGAQPLGRGLRAAVEHIDHRWPGPAETGAQGFALLDARHEEAPRALRPQPPRHRDRAQAVAVRLDHRRDLGGPCLAHQDGVVVRECVQVDGQAGGGGHWPRLAGFCGRAKPHRGPVSS